MGLTDARSGWGSAQLRFALPSSIGVTKIIGSSTSLNFFDSRDNVFLEANIVSGIVKSTLGEIESLDGSDQIAATNTIEAI